MLVEQDQKFTLTSLRKQTTNLSWLTQAHHSRTSFSCSGIRVTQSFCIARHVCEEKEIHQSYDERSSKSATDLLQHNCALCDPNLKLVKNLSLIHTQFKTQ